MSGEIESKQLEYLRVLIEPSEFTGISHVSEGHDYIFLDLELKIITLGEVRMKKNRQGNVLLDESELSKVTQINLNTGEVTHFDGAYELIRVKNLVSHITPEISRVTGFKTKVLS